MEMRNTIEFDLEKMQISSGEVTQDPGRVYRWCRGGLEKGNPKVKCERQLSGDSNAIQMPLQNILSPWGCFRVDGRGTLKTSGPAKLCQEADCITFSLSKEVQKSCAREKPRLGGKQSTFAWSSGWRREDYFGSHPGMVRTAVPFLCHPLFVK